MNKIQFPILSMKRPLITYILQFASYGTLIKTGELKNKKLVAAVFDALKNTPIIDIIHIPEIEVIDLTRD
jgi:hypothetical protein